MLSPPGRRPPGGTAELMITTMIAIRYRERRMENQ